MAQTTIVVHKDREKPVRNKHPWIFSRGIAKIQGEPRAGEIVNVVSQSGEFLAQGYWNPKSQIQLRLLTWENEPINPAWWHQKIQQAITSRPSGVMMQRLINAENDYLPGLVVDLYGDVAVLQALTLGIDQRKHEIANILSDLLPIKTVYERSDVDVRKKEGLNLVTGLLWGEEPPDLIEVSELERKILVDVRAGHKTGYYLDQAASRKTFINLLQHLHTERPHLRILNLFSYSGSFGLHALPYGEVTQVDSSRDVLELAEQIEILNFGTSQATYLQANTFELLRDLARDGEQFDVIVCDPPKFAHNVSQIDKATRGYKDLNMNCLKLLAHGGYLFTFSCSGAISRDLFQKVVFGAASDSKRQAQIIQHLGHAPDHPIAITFPEGEYLKGLMLRAE